ncbi:putative integral membrane protein DUF2269 [Kribbella sp. VKM Ac-2569]|uniref:DUF2269 family protein n=1 Tax=Kribbella sp. VKM Ac-2569 TaxID=2512220 RepID=UPI00102D1A56|nr:DUF2269 family protein [Kribbella sp. VKM Ac-2569]RZT17335.1 putative integral membrane protein DUF2269 [Kribbella sp. VKM Ac-2569]
MNKFLLSVHVLAAIIFVGPVTIAASMFPPIARRTLLAEAPDAAVLAVLHRISKVYAIGGLAVPVFGLAVAGGMGVLGDYWLIISMILTLVAAALLAFVVIPTQSRVLAAAAAGPDVRTALLPQAKALSMTTGVFALLWAVVVVLMIVRPGSTTGA